jgi:hypothetical protein
VRCDLDLVATTCSSAEFDARSIPASLDRVGSVTLSLNTSHEWPLHSLPPPLAGPTEWHYEPAALGGAHAEAGRSCSTAQLRTLRPLQKKGASERQARSADIGQDWARALRGRSSFEARD